MIDFRISGLRRIGKAICVSCKHAAIVLGQNCEERICAARCFHSGIVTFKVAQCGAYHPMNMSWKHEMEAMAWIVQARRRGPTGFQKPEEGEMEVTIKPPSGGGYQATPDETGSE